MGCPWPASTTSFPNPACPSQRYGLSLILPCHLSIIGPLFILLKHYLSELQVIIYVLLLYFNFAIPDIVLAQSVGHWLMLGILFIAIVFIMMFHL